MQRFNNFMCDLVGFIDWNITRMNGRSVVMTFLFEWMSLLFAWFVLSFRPWLFYMGLTLSNQNRKSPRPLANSQTTKRSSSYQN